MSRTLHKVKDQILRSSVLYLHWWLSFVTTYTRHSILIDSENKFYSGYPNEILEDIWYSKSKVEVQYSQIFLLVSNTSLRTYN